MTWRLPVATMSRVDTPTARLLAGTFGGDVDRGERESVPADSASMVLTVDEWRARNREVDQ